MDKCIPVFSGHRVCHKCKWLRILNLTLGGYSGGLASKCLVCNESRGAENALNAGIPSEAVAGLFNISEMGLGCDPIPEYFFDDSECNELRSIPEIG